MRPEDGARGRFRWARQTTREANCAATAYILGGLGAFGADDVINDDDRRQGAAWVQSFHVGEGQFRDPAIVDRKPDDWPADQPWPGAPLLTVVNGYSHSVL